MAQLSVADLDVRYRVEEGQVRAVDGVSFEIPEGTIVGLLGESGCGKSTLAKSLIRFLPGNGSIEGGEIRFGGEDVLAYDDRELRRYRWEHVAYIPQSAMNSLDPVYTIREQLGEVIRTHRPDTPREELIGRVEDAFDLVGISAERLDDYPHQMSGGMKQRILIGMALLLDPDVVIADEPTTGLDVLVRDKILNDLERYQEEFGISILFVSHDIADLVETCQELIVMYGGKIVETGPSRDLFSAPVHPYMIGLKHSLPTIQADPADLISMKMDPPDLVSPGGGCRFAEKCPFVEVECRDAHPPLREHRAGVRSACFRGDESATFRERATEVDWHE